MATRNVLAFQSGGLSNLRDLLLADVPLETAHFLFARPVLTPGGGWRLVVCDSYPIGAADYLSRSEVAIDLSPQAVAGAMQRARADGLSIVITHSHPSARVVAPSDRDRAGESRLLEAFGRRIPNTPHARLIVGPDALHAAIFDPKGGELPLAVTDIGSEISVLADDTNSLDQFESIDTGQFDRQVRAFGAVGQQKVARSTAAVLGVGGTGSVVTQQLAHLGVTDFLLIDPDVIEPSNLNRVVGAERMDIGRPKVEIAERLIHRINPLARVNAVRGDVRNSSIARLVLNADLFFLCTDSQGSRAVMAQVAYQYYLPGFDIGVAIRVDGAGISHVSGRVQMIGPSLPCLLCCGVLDSEEVRQDLLSDQARTGDHYLVGRHAPQPAVISINSAAASMAVTMFLSAVAGVPFATRNMRLRLESGLVSRVESKAVNGCPVCSSSGALARGDSWPFPGRTP